MLDRARLTQVLAFAGAPHPTLLPLLPSNNAESNHGKALVQQMTAFVSKTLTRVDPCNPGEALYA